MNRNHLFLFDTNNRIFVKTRWAVQRANHGGQLRPLAEVWFVNMRPHLCAYLLEPMMNAMHVMCMFELDG
jgi:hypothetical protein